MLRRGGYAGQAGGVMNTLILNRGSFKMPDDGCCPLAPIGEFPHGGAGVIQGVDAEACAAMAARFMADAAVESFPAAGGLRR